MFKQRGRESKAPLHCWGDEDTLSLGKGLSSQKLLSGDGPVNPHWIPTQEKGNHVHIKSCMQMFVAILLRIIKRSQPPNVHQMING